MSSIALRRIGGGGGAPQGGGGGGDARVSRRVDGWMEMVCRYNT